MAKFADEMMVIFKTNLFIVFLMVYEHNGNGTSTIYTPNASAVREQIELLTVKAQKPGQTGK